MSRGTESGAPRHGAREPGADVPRTHGPGTHGPGTREPGVARSGRRPSPLGGRRPTRAELADFTDGGIDDVVGPAMRLLVVGINPGLWTAAVNAPFAHPGNRFWPALAGAGLMPHRVDASRGLSEEDWATFTGRGLGLTNLVDRATARADQLDATELVEGRAVLEEKVARWRPRVVAVVGITAYRTAYAERKAVLGRQDRAIAGAEVWVLPQPSGLNAHAPLPVLIDWWRQVGRAAGLATSPDPA